MSENDLKSTVFLAAVAKLLADNEQRALLIAELEKAGDRMGVEQVKEFHRTHAPRHCDCDCCRLIGSAP